MKDIYGICFVYYEGDSPNNDEHIEKVTLLNFFENKWELYISDCEVSRIISMLKNSKKIITLSPAASKKTYDDLSDDEYAVVTYKLNNRREYITTLPDTTLQNNLGSLPNNVLYSSYWEYIED